MKFNRLGNSGLQVSALGLGTNAFGKRADEKPQLRLSIPPWIRASALSTPPIFMPARNRSGSSD